MNITKGKWEPDFNQYRQSPTVIYTGIRIERAPNYYERIFDTILTDIASDKEYKKQHEEIRANVILVSNAPEMYRAVKAIAEINIENPDFVDVDDAIRCCRNLMKQIEEDFKKYK